MLVVFVVVGLSALLAVNVPKAIRVAGNTSPTSARGPTVEPEHLLP
ncbi:MAG TPA: hypothetical protein VJT72_16905 [Pseudonocardiaceae bacterium]|nr:hypothetical protein [Pseudonocardiaceae bacterium]